MWGRGGRRIQVEGKAVTVVHLIENYFTFLAVGKRGRKKTTRKPKT
jgi:hypothetical protein